MTMERKQGRAADRAKPRIILTAEDHERLSTLVRAATGPMPDAASLLDGELARARVLGRGRYPDHTVCMGSTVEFRDDTTGKVQTVQVVYPDEADILRGRISVLTPVGTALIGLQAGASINWETRTGDLKRLTVLQVGSASIATRA